MSIVHSDQFLLKKKKKASITSAMWQETIQSNQRPMF